LIVEEDIFGTPSQELEKEDWSPITERHTETAFEMASGSAARRATEAPLGLGKEMGRAFWKLELPDDDRFDGENMPVTEFIPKLRGEVSLGVKQGFLSNEDEALEHLSSKQFSGTALTWLYAELETAKSFNDFLKSLTTWFGTKTSDTDKKVQVMTMKKKRSESSRGFAIRLKAANNQLTAKKLDVEELKYAFLQGHKKPHLQRLRVKSKPWEDPDVTFDDLVDRIAEREDPEDSDDGSSRRGIRDEDIKRVAEEAAKAAVRETKAGMQKDIASIKEELRLTGPGRSRMPPKRVFLTEEEGNQFDDEEQEAVEAFLTERRGFQDQPRPQAPYGNRPSYGFQNSNGFQNSSYQNPQSAWKPNPYQGQQTAPQTQPGPDATAQALQQVTAMLAQLLQSQQQNANSQPTAYAGRNLPTGKQASDTHPSNEQRKDFGGRT
jgi:hypothetical protein